MAELCRPLRARNFIRYAGAKFTEDMARESYLFDCLWAMATDMRFVEHVESGGSSGSSSSDRGRARATLKRWVEFRSAKRGERLRQNSTVEVSAKDSPALSEFLTKEGAVERLRLLKAELGL